MKTLPLIFLISFTRLLLPCILTLLLPIILTHSSISTTLVILLNHVFRLLSVLVVLNYYYIRKAYNLVCIVFAFCMSSLFLMMIGCMDVCMYPHRSSKKAWSPHNFLYTYPLFSGFFRPTVAPEVDDGEAREAGRG